MKDPEEVSRWLEPWCRNSSALATALWGLTLLRPKGPAVISNHYSLTTCDSASGEAHLPWEAEVQVA